MDVTKTRALASWVRCVKLVASLAHGTPRLGMCCLHCGGKAGRPRYGRFFPSCLKTLAKPASCDRIANHLSNECPQCPPEVLDILHKLQIRELSKNIRYGSRNIFFQRLWNRLHGDKAPVARDVCRPDAEQREAQTPAIISKHQWKLLLEGSVLVTEEDKGLVPDDQLASVRFRVGCFVLPSLTGMYGA